jgi:nucleoside-diphosphate-sugar epimerase
MMAEIERRRGLPEIRVLAESLEGCDVVVNAAGVATATGHGDSLFGANALLPGLLVAVAPSNARFVHVSSAAVQGRLRVLNETEERAPFSPYSLSKSLGEQVVLATRPGAVCYRPTSVHGPGRDVTRSLVRVLKSPLASVAGTGELPSPQVRVENVGDAVALLATTEEAPPRVVLHPSEGMTTGNLVRILGGREPLRMPWGLARAAVAVAFFVGRAVPASAGVARRLEMLWFGQGQGPSWLSERWSPDKGIDSWKELT